MKLNNTTWTIVIILLVAIIGFILIFKNNNITGQAYNYGSFFGPQGQRPVYAYESRFIPAKEQELRQYNAACCYNVMQCPSTKEEFYNVCSVEEDDELKLTYLPCPSANYKPCFIPLE